MVRPLTLASLIAFAVLPTLPGTAGTARADGFIEPAPLRHVRPPHRHSVRHTHAPRRVRHAWGGFGLGPAPDLAYGWLPRNLNLPIYNAPSEGPAPQL